MTLVQPSAAPARRGQQQQPQRPVVKFLDGTYQYSEPFAPITFTPGATGVDLTPYNIIPGGFLRGVNIIITATGGTLGTGVVSADNPWSLFSYITLESIDGTPILYPMSGYRHYLISRFTRPWDGDPATDPFFASGINPSFRLFIAVESRATLGVLPNTDARAQYRLRIGANPLTNTNPENGLLTTVGTATPPTVTLNVTLETYAQPPRTTYTGAPIQPLPDGLAVQRFVSNQVDVTVTGDQTIKLNRTGNLVRSIILVYRDVNGNRVDQTADPIRWRVDNTQLLVESRARRDFEMFKFFSTVTAPGTTAVAVRPTGVYVWFRWMAPGEMRGQAWLQTIEATFLQFELQGSAAGGTQTAIIEDLVPVPGGVPASIAQI